MSYSNYSLNNRVSYLEYEIGQLTPIPAGGYVPINGDVTVNNIKTFSTLPKSAVVPLANDDLVNKLYVDTHGGGGSQNLSQVLTTGNSAGSSSIDMNTNAISNISTATAKTSLIVNNGVAGQNSILTDKSLTVNNATLNGVPLSINNLNNAGLLFTEEYNQRTAIGGETIRNSYYAKNSAGTKTEYSRIHINTPAITAGSERGKLDFDVKDAGGSSNYLSLNGNTNQVDVYRTLHTNANNIDLFGGEILNVDGTKYAPILQVNANSNIQVSITPTNLNPHQVYLKSAPIPLNDRLVNFSNLPSSETVICNCWTGSYFYIGCASGNVYVWNTGSNAFDLLASFNGAINTMVYYSPFSKIIIGGNFQDLVYPFSQTGLNYTCYFDNNNILSGLGVYVWSNLSSNGFNGIVNSITTDGSTWIYYAGDFTTDYNSSLSCPHFACFEISSTQNLYSLDGGSGYGFDGSVYNIKYASGVICATGSFQNVFNGSGNYYSQYCVGFNISGYNGSGYQSLGSNAYTLNNSISTLNTLETDGGSFYIGTNDVTLGCNYIIGAPYYSFASTFTIGGNNYLSQPTSMFYSGALNSVDGAGRYYSNGYLDATFVFTPYIMFNPQASPYNTNFISQGTTSIYNFSGNNYNEFVFSGGRYLWYNGTQYTGGLRITQYGSGYGNTLMLFWDGVSYTVQGYIFQYSPF